MQSARLLIVHSNTAPTVVHFSPKVLEEGKEILECSNKKHQTSLFSKHLLLREETVSTIGLAGSLRVTIPHLHRLQITQFL